MSASRAALRRQDRRLRRILLRISRDAARLCRGEPSYWWGLVPDPQGPPWGRFVFAPNWPGQPRLCCCEIVMEEGPSPLGGSGLGVYHLGNTDRDSEP